MKNLTFVTSNPSKAKQLSWHLGMDILHKSIDLVEIQSLSLSEIVEYKAREAFKFIGKPVLVDDTSLEINAIGNLPGPLAKWFLKAIDNDGLCKLLDGYEDRSAVAAVLFGYYDGSELKTFGGKMAGSIAKAPRGVRGFGWDPIFIPTGCTKTWGEMTIEEQSSTSMRRIALKKLEHYLNIQSHEV